MRAPKNRHSTDGIVTSDAVRARKKMSVPHVGRHKRLIMIALGVLVIALAVYGIFKVFYYKSPVIVDSSNGNTYTITDKQYAEQQAKLIKSTAPPAGASADQQVKYYSSLMGAELDSQDYKGVIQNYEKLQAVVASPELPFNTYIFAAKAYVKLGNTTAATTALEHADTAAKNQTTDPDRLQSYNDAIATIRQEMKNGQ